MSSTDPETASETVVASHVDDGVEVVVVQDTCELRHLVLPSADLTPSEPDTASDGFYAVVGRLLGIGAGHLAAGVGGAMGQILGTATDTGPATYRKAYLDALNQHYDADHGNGYRKYLDSITGKRSKR